MYFMSVKIALMMGYAAQLGSTQYVNGVAGLEKKQMLSSIRGACKHNDLSIFVSAAMSLFTLWVEVKQERTLGTGDYCESLRGRVRISSLLGSLGL